MVKEVLGSNFVNCESVKAILLRKGFKKAEIRKMKKVEGIKTLAVRDKSGATIWLWFDPQQIFDKHSTECKEQKEDGE